MAYIRRKLSYIMDIKAPIVLLINTYNSKN